GDDGFVEVDVPVNASGKVRGWMEGRASKAASIRSDAPKIVEMTLEKLPEGAPPEPRPTILPPSSDPAPPVPESGRSWTEALTVTSSGNEPHLAVDSKGVIYYAPTSALYKSTDGGRSFGFVPITTAAPTLGSDTSVSLGPDDSVWFSRYWGYAGGTLACTSTNKGESWTCDNAALPGATDRMWVVGLSATEGYVQTNEGLYHHVWAKTTTGSTKYAPHGSTTTVLAVRNGPMVYDAKNKAVYQIEFTGGTHKLYRVDGLGGVLSPTDTGVPATYALPWLSVHDGVLWTTGEPNQKVIAARSTDGGKTWKKFSVSQAPKSATFSYIAAGPEGRVALVYYGSDKQGPSPSNGGMWSLYVAETDNGLDANPTWVETQLVPKVHKGNICIGLNCEQTGGDAYARFSGERSGRSTCARSAWDSLATSTREQNE
ncbi:MAG: hypothetical protein HYT80_07800, partial [Euryarchaeota archaeon]|nr:hypothetical protein [Euryarchaeota archaeon]